MATGKQTKAAYEKSGFDKDKGVKEGSPADMKRDARAMPAFLNKSKGKPFEKGGSVAGGKGGQKSFRR